MKFLDYKPPEHKSSDWDIAIHDDKPLDEVNNSEISPENEVDTSYGADDQTDKSDDEIEARLNPQPKVKRTLRDRTLQVKLAKYSYLLSDPTSFKNAMKSSKRDQWNRATDKELNNIEHHDVWEDEFNTPNSFLRTLWIFKTKPATLSAEEQKKARLCIQGFLQKEGVDYGNTFAPTGKFTTLLIILMFAINKQLPIRQFDVKSAFLYAPLQEELYIKTPEGSKRKAPFLRLKKSLYGLKQAPANWYETLTSWFKDINYSQSTSDPCLFIHNDKNSFIFFHVNDLI